MANHEKIRSGIQKALTLIKMGIIPRQDWRRTVDILVAPKAGPDVTVGDIRGELVKMQHEAERLARLEQNAERHGSSTTGPYL